MKTTKWNGLKRTPLKRSTKPICKISKKQAKRKRNLRNMDAYFLDRSEGYCEICGKYFGYIGKFGLHKAHIEPASVGVINDTKENIIAACGECHNHHKWPSGLICGKEKAKEIVRKRIKRATEE